MEPIHYVIIAGFVALIVIVYFLRDRIGSGSAGKDGIRFQAHKPQEPGKVLAEDVTSKKGAATITGNTGGDVSAKRITAAEDVNITANPESLSSPESPKS